MPVIIEHGTDAKKQEYQTTCKKCGCVFKFQAAEAFLQRDQRDGDALKIACPEPWCNNPCWISP